MNIYNFYINSKDLINWHEDNPNNYGEIQRKKDNRFHHKTKPSVEYACGDKVWYFHGKLHREDGPAIERVSGPKYWFLNGIRYSKADWNKKLEK
jgi:hypothetical protein